ncbi:Sec63-domain-containing protein [Fomitiporia mediterranea MF3/22]|uniref:Sec63-domain-containing protein n=1 Tax=Fomitiporia mediterranea (strain MF3/22) TaxID=694068 RepID=UPI000440957D|nr:Sec63-domain-containing protein [Fomitiporia mediterranea MF3/22]EJD01188.1 Sec63-domain-containing protein [Fomitiporia mediterranea MF3/22]
MLMALHSILSSAKSDETASIELAELVGFEEIELVSDIIAQRQMAASKLEALLTNPTPVTRTPEASQSAPPSVHGRKKGKKGYGSRPDTPTIDLDPVAAQRRIDETLRANAARPLFTGMAYHMEQEVLPHVYTSSSFRQNNILSDAGAKYLLPVDTERHMYEEYEEVIIPPARPIPPRVNERLISVSELDDLCKGSFPGYSSLNRIQSIVYPTAYSTNENMLICAPTGAGKTDVAMLSVLRVLNEFRSGKSEKTALAAQIRRDDFKIIYVAPMKALASEIVRKLGRRLKWLSIKVRELTGDMQMTKAEIAETQIIVTTPEKWDVVTRKPTGEGELATKVKLLIIDEVHLLNDERGSVIETIVARTLRQVESTQSMIRIVGLSATLPNFVDVADFLRVSRQAGLFYFDSSFRPIPLEQHFLGLRGKPGTAQARKILDNVTYEKVTKLVEEGHQVMVFVHARKETVKSAFALRDAAHLGGTLDNFSCQEHAKWDLFRREIGESRNKEMRELFDLGFGIHHAGMLRSDRNLMERLFEARAIKVLCCTATLAWGVNLPAHAVIIKGTEVYDSNQGKFVNLSVLDVLQIFGRAGRPGMETSGEGFICTGIDKLDHYLDAVTAQHPIESKFVEGMSDSLNAEIALGTVSNVAEAVQWIGYTYLFVRLRKNPRYHGITYEEVIDDPQLGRKRRELVQRKATQLAEARMIVFDKERETFASTDLGRIAAKYYIRAQTVVIFNETFRPKMSEADVLYMLCKSTEFEQIQLRENEIKELKYFLEDQNIVPCEVKDGTNSSQGKVNILLQAYISRVYPEDFALVSDMAYVAQNAGRIIRALLEIGISRKWANVGSVLVSFSKAVEKRIWPFDHPFMQLGDSLKRELMVNLQRFADDYTPGELAQMTAQELGDLVHMNTTHGSALLRAAKEFPTLELSYELRPLTSDLLRVSVHAKRLFTWGSKRKDTVEPFWIWIEDLDGGSILQLSHVIFRQSTEQVDCDFIVQTTDAMAVEGLTIRYVSDRWMGAEDELHVDMSSLVKPKAFESFTQILAIPFLDLEILGNETLKSVFGAKLQNLNGVQTHSCWSMLSTNQNALLCAPPGSGKSLLAQTLIAKTLQKAKAGLWALVISPKRGIATDIASGLRQVLGPLGIPVEIIGQAASFSHQNRKVVRVIHPRVILDMLEHPSFANASDFLRLVLCENLELLDAEYELAISLLLHATQNRPTRFVGLSTSLTDASDLADWLRVPSLCMSCFRPSDREQDLRTSIQTFTIPYSAALFKSMAKPAHSAISSGGGEFALVFVPSRSQCKPVANDLITQCAMDLKMQGYLPVDTSPDALEPYLARLQDQTLADLITRGIGIFHDGVHRSDRALMLELCAEGIVRVLIAPRDALWSVPMRAGVVVVMGTQYLRFDGASRTEDPSRRDRQIAEYPLAEVVHMQGRAARHAQAGHFHLLCQAEGRETLTRFQDEGIPLESTLHESSVFKDWLHARWKYGRISSVDTQQTLDILSWTYLTRRMESNPMYYDAVPGDLDTSLSRLVDRLHGDT